MAHEIEIRLESFTADEHHKIRNFLEALWLALGDEGWATWDDFDALFNQRVKPGARFTFEVTTKRKLRSALELVDRVIVSHMMGLYTVVSHRKVEDG
jgi:hypothetical protein